MRILLSSLILIVLSAAVSFAQIVPVVQDSGNGAKYDELPANCVQITNMDLATAQIESGRGYTITDGYGPYDKYMEGMLVWTGKLPEGFGSKNTTNDADAELRRNRLPDVTLRFPDGARTSDGTYCDILLTLSEITYDLGKSNSSRIDNDTTLKLILMAGWGYLETASPRTKLTKNVTAEGNTAAGCSMGERLKVTMQIVNKGTDTPVSASFSTMLIEFLDLDIEDKTVRKSAGRAVQSKGFYTEGVEMVSGWVGNAVIGPDTSDPANTRLVDSVKVNGNTKIKADGAKIEEYVEAFDLSNGDSGTLWSGFVAAVRPQQFSFYWTGSMLGSMTANRGIATQIGGQPTVAVRAMRTGGGAAASYLGGRGTYSSVGAWYTNTHLMNTENVVYSAIPGEGTYLNRLKVDGASQAVSENEALHGKAYTFAKLNKYPLPERDVRTGQVLAARDSGFYTIEADFGHLPKYRAEKINDKEVIRLDSDEVITYQIVCEEIYDDAPAGEHVLHDDLAGGILVVDPDSVTLSERCGSAAYELTENGLDIRFESEAANGSRPRMVLSYRASVDWDKYRAAEGEAITNTAEGQNRPEVGGDRTGNPVTTAVTSDIRITKTVKGRLRDMSKYFEFQLELTGLGKHKSYIIETIGGGEAVRAVTGRLTPNGFESAENGEAVLLIKAKGQQGIGIKDLPIGCTYRVTEAASDHTASYELQSGADAPVFAKRKDENHTNKKELSTETETLDKEDAVVTAAFTNTRDPAAITGIRENFRWLSAAGAAILLFGSIRIKRRAHHGQ